MSLNALEIRVTSAITVAYLVLFSVYQEDAFVPQEQEVHFLAISFFFLNAQSRAP
jgi:hypothetical protein